MDPTSAHPDYLTRFQRVRDAVALKEPDRVPIVPVFQAFPVYYGGGTVQKCMEDWNEAGKCYDVFYSHFKPDLGWDPILLFPTKYLERSGITWFRWPGKHIEDPQCMYQYIEGEYMKQDEYGEAIRDLTRFMMTKWMPRSFANFQGLAHIDFRNCMWFGHMGALAAFADPTVRASLRAMIETGEILCDWFQFLGAYDQKMEKDFGIPVLYGSFAYAPFDMIGDSMRGTEAILCDLMEKPEEMLQLIDIITDMAIPATIQQTKAAGRPWVWFWLHKGVDEFMSDEMFAKFYWPSLRKYITALAEAGLTPVVYVEGRYNTRLQHLLEVPKGKVIYSFEYTDMKAAKRVLGGHSCIMGNVPAFLLSYGKKQQVMDYCKELIDTCAPGGGYILDSGTMIDDAITENVEAMFEAVEHYGRR